MGKIGRVPRSSTEEHNEGLSQGTVVAVGAGVGSFVLLVAALTLFMIWSKRRDHKSAVTEIEQDMERSHDRPLSGVTIPPPLSTDRKSSATMLYGANNGWEALSSNEMVQDIPLVAQYGKQLSANNIHTRSGARETGSPISKRAKIGRALSFKRKRLKHLSAIVESPRTGQGLQAPIVDAQSTVALVDNTKTTVAPVDMKSIYDKAQVTNSRRNPGWPDEIVSLQEALQPLAILPVAERPPVPRSKSMVAITVTIPENALLAQNSRPRPSLMHQRSLSFGALVAGPAPTGPLPPLPERAVLLKDHRASPEPLRSFSGPATSHSPNWTKVPIGSNESISVDDPCIARDSPGSRTPLPTRPLPTYSTAARFSIGSFVSHRTSTSSDTCAGPDGANHLSVPQVQMADRMSISRVSSSGSLQSDHSVRVLTTPRRRVSRVSTTGSPAERKRSSVLRPVSGNGSTNQRAPSVLDSPAHSDTSNPFQWDVTTQICKPSAMKGSPNARKGHRRQNCVRISTLKPTVLGPSSRSNSPSLNEIAEESPDNLSEKGPFTRRVDLRSPDDALAPDARLDPTKLRASLTPSSPTLSLSNFYHEYLPHSRPISACSSRRNEMSHSPQHSLFSIPSFPSLHNETENQESETPTIEFTRPSTDLEEPDDERILAFSPSSTSGAETGFKNDHVISKTHEYDPAWPTFESQQPPSSKAYKPESPCLDYPTPTSSSPTFPFANGFPDTGCSDPIGVAFSPPRTDTLVLPPASPRSKPTHIPLSPPDMYLVDVGDSALSPPSSGDRSSPGRALQSPLTVHPLSHVPILQPTTNSIFVPHPQRQAPSPPNISIIASDPTQSNRNATPLSPRSQPARNVRKSIALLRRMNSELQVSDPQLGGGGKRYLKLGREASPLLPFTGHEYDDDIHAYGNEDDENHDPNDDVEQDDGRHDLNDHLAPPPDEWLMHRWSNGGGFDFGFNETRLMGDIHSPRAPSSTDLSSHSLSDKQAPGLQRRASTVWDDGEGYWKDDTSSNANAQSPKQQSTSVSTPTRGKRKEWVDVTFSPDPRTPVKDVSSSASRDQEGKEGTGPLLVGGMMLTPRLRIIDPNGRQRGSVQLTPKSLYDADGFLQA